MIDMNKKYRYRSGETSETIRRAGIRIYRLPRLVGDALTRLRR